MRARVKTQLKVKHMSDELRRLATEDSLTGAATRRCFDEALQRELALAQRSGEPLTLLMMDIDHFKRYNDHYGHPAGDACLRAVAAAARSACQRPTDLLARVGGEEFAVLLPQTSLLASVHVAERVLDAVAALALPHRGVGADARVGLSIGASCYVDGGRRQRETDEGSAPSLERLAIDLLGAADRALYEAKRSGRNRACASSMDSEGEAGGVYPIARATRSTATS